VTCGIIYISYFVTCVIGLWVRGEVSRNDCGDVTAILAYAVLPVGGMILFLYILATYVVFAEDDDPPLSGGLEVVAFVLYGINALLVGGTPLFVFCFFNVAKFMFLNIH